MTRESSGGKAEASGGDYETRVAAWYCTQLLLGRSTHPPLNLPSNVYLVRVSCQTAESVDDINVETSDRGTIFVQVKHGLDLSKRADSPLAKTLNQFVRQQKKNAELAETSPNLRRLDVRDRLVLTAPRRTSRMIVDVLPRMLVGLRANSKYNLLSEVQSSNDEKKVASVIENHLRRIWLEVYGVAVSDTEIGELLRLIWVQTLDVEDGEVDHANALTHLRSQLLEDPDQANVAFSLLVDFCGLLRSKGYTCDQGPLLDVLRGKTIALKRRTQLNPRKRQVAIDVENIPSSTFADPNFVRDQSWGGRNESGQQTPTIRSSERVWTQEISGLLSTSWPKMVTLPRGCYLRGCLDIEDGSYTNERPQRKVCIDYDLAVGQGPVTVDEFAAFVQETNWNMGTRARVFICSTWRYVLGTNWSRPPFMQSGNHPVTCVSWHDAQAYADWLNGKLDLRGQSDQYRLLSESEWEYACRGNTETSFSFGRSLGTNQANFSENKMVLSGHSTKRRGTTPVGTYPANPFGLYDMHGNVWEWCLDLWHESYNGAPCDGSPWLESTGDLRRIARGGSFNSEVYALRSARRGRCFPDDRDFDQGFRLARTLKT